LKPLKLARSQHDRKASNTRFDNNSDRRGNGPIELAYCWAHARRKLFELTINNVAPIAEEGIKQIKAFYPIEAQIRNRCFFIFSACHLNDAFTNKNP
jgi:hypothetical protein